MALRLGGGSLQNLDLAINAQNLRHLLLELGIATFQIVAHLVRLDFLLAEDLAHRALNQLGETFVPRRRSVLACVTCQKPRRPQLMRIAVLLGLVARQRHQPGFGLRCDDRFFARPWPILDRRQRPIAQRPLHAALNRLMVNPNSLPHRTERRILAIGQQHLRPRYPARRLGSRPRKSRQSFNLFVRHRQFDCSPPSCHDAAPRFANRKTRNPSSNHRFHDAGFMESIVWSLIRKSVPSGHDMGGRRFSLGTNAKRSPGDHAQTKIKQRDEIMVRFNPIGS